MRLGMGFGIDVGSVMRRPAYDLNFMGGMPAGLTYTNSSTARAYWDATGTRKTAVANEPIFETLGGVYQGMRWEMEARTNLATNSEGAAATWTLFGVSDASSAITGFAASLQFGDNSSTRTADKRISITAGVTYAVSVFVQMDDGNAPVVGTSSSTGDFAIISDTLLHSATATVQRISGNIYRVSSARVATVGGAARACGIYKYTGQSARTFRVIGIQVEAAASASSYIQTAGSAVTRQPDVLTATSISPWYRQGEGTVVFEGIASAITASNQGLFVFSNGTNAERIFGRVPATSGIVRAGIFTGDAVQATPIAAAVAAGARFKFVVGVKESSFVSASDGTLGSPILSGSMPSGINALTFGVESASGGTAPFMGYARRFQYYNRRLTNSEIQGLSRV